MTTSLRLFLLTLFPFSLPVLQADYLKISAEEYRDKMKAAWIGQMAGVGWGLPTEFKYIGEIIPEDQMPAWEQAMINQQGNDDLYVEMTFLRTMEQYGVDVSARQAGIDFANTGFMLWAANYQGRENLRQGIAPPDSSHPEVTPNAEDIDYQIESDFSGIIAPGMPQVAVELGEKFGRLMNYGDGLYGGQFVGGMYAAAYFSKDLEAIIESGLSCIPEESNYARMVRDVLRWHKQHPDSWEATWEKVMEKYYRSMDQQPFYRQQEGSYLPIDAKLNGTFIVIGLLYGAGDMDETITIATRCGLDSDCNPSNAAGVLATTIGYKNLPERYRTGLDYDRKFSYTEYNLTDLFRVSEQFTREFILRNGGEIEWGADNREYFYIAQKPPQPTLHQLAYQPGPFDPGNQYTPEELARIKAWPSAAFDGYFSGTEIEPSVEHCGKDIEPGPLSWGGEESVLLTTPMSNDRGVLIRLRVPYDPELHGDAPYFTFKAGHDPGQRWKLGTLRNVVSRIIGPENSTDGWVELSVPAEIWDDKVRMWIFANNIDGLQARNYFADFALHPGFTADDPE